ncbi:MAG: hypothetical protein WKF80_13095 [Thermomicrobiales bacterium]
MSRRSTATMSMTSVLVAIISLTLAATPLRITTQGDVNGRLDDLETTVADQADEIADLDDALGDVDDRVATLEAGDDEGDGDNGDVIDTSNDGNDPGGSSAGGTTFSGTGPTATDPFDLAAGSYRLEATCDGGFIFTLEIQRLDGDEFVFSSLIGVPPYEGSEVLTVAGGRYVISVTCDGAWALALGRLG